MSVSVGVDIGGTKILAGLVSERGEILKIARRKTPRTDSFGVLGVVAEVVDEIISEVEGVIEGVGVGVAGPVDPNGTTVLFAPNLQWADVPVRDLLEDATGLFIMVENDGNAAAWGEAKFGAGRNSSSVVTVTVGTGIGGGVVLNGELLRGAHGAAGEIGHMGAVPDGLQCGCGRKGCWEQYASGNALVRETRRLETEKLLNAQILLALGDGTPEGVTGEHITEAAQKGDPVAIASLEQLGVWLGRGLASLTAILDPEVFVIGGGVSEAGELLLASARITLAERVIGRSHRPIPEIRVAELGNMAGIVGAASLASLRFASIRS